MKLSSRKHGLITRARTIGELEFYCKKFVFEIIGKCMKMLLRRDFKLLGTARLRKRLITTRFPPPLQFLISLVIKRLHPKAMPLKCLLLPRHI
jgi:hypothetical protein